MGVKHSFNSVQKDGVESEGQETALKAGIVELDPPLGGHDDVQAFLAASVADNRIYHFGRKTANAGSYLQTSGGIYSNVSGLPIALGGVLDVIRVFNTDADTYTLVVFEHGGNLSNRTDLRTLAVVSSLSGSVININEAVTAGKQLAVEVTLGNTKNISVSCILKG